MLAPAVGVFGWFFCCFLPRFCMVVSSTFHALGVGLTGVVCVLGQLAVVALPWSVGVTSMALHFCREIGNLPQVEDRFFCLGDVYHDVLGFDPLPIIICP